MVVLGTMNARIFFSRDAGQHWIFVPDSNQIPSITEFHWKSANSVIVAIAGRGLWEVEIELRQPLVRLPAACPDCSFLRRVGVPLSPPVGNPSAQPTNRPQDPVLLVMDGRVAGVESTPNGTTVIVTPGSSHVWFGRDQARFPVEIVEQSKGGGFAGLPEAGQLEQQGFAIRGLSIDRDTITGIVYGKGEATLPPIRFVPLAKPPGTPTLGLNERPYLTFNAPELHGLSIPEGAKLVVRGQNFNPGVPVVVLIDDRIVVTGPADQGGRFELSFPVNVAHGTHAVLATQKQGQGELRVAMGLNVVHADPAGEK